MSALRINAITGVSMSDLEAAYNTNTLTSTQINSTNFPFSSIKDSIISSVGKLVRSYAFVDGHPFRANNLSQTAIITHKDVIPAVDAGGKSIVGVYGAITDAATGRELTESSVQLIENIISSRSNNSLLRPYYHYKIAGNRLLHTVLNAKIDVCVFDAAAELAAIPLGNAPLPSVLLDAAWSGVVSELVRDDEFVNQAALCANYFNNVMAEIKQGKVEFTPAPTLINTVAPGVS